LALVVELLLAVVVELELAVVVAVGLSLEALVGQWVRDDYYWMTTIGSLCRRPASLCLKLSLRRTLVRTLC
jgi:hypothetical protein